MFDDRLEALKKRSRVQLGMHLWPKFLKQKTCFQRKSKNYSDNTIEDNGRYILVQITYGNKAIDKALHQCIQSRHKSLPPVQNNL